jgi:hypothetical protein
MVAMVEALGEGIGKHNVSEAFAGVVSRLAGIAATVGTVLTDFAAMTYESIQKAVEGLNAAARAAPQIAKAMKDMAIALKEAFDAAGIDEVFAKGTDAIGKTMDNVSSVIQFAASIPGMMPDLEKFTTMTFGNTWQGIGSSISNLINDVVGAMDAIPDVGKLETALTAVGVLRDIFAAMVELQQSALNAMTGVAVTANARLRSVPALGAASGPVQVNVSWQTLTGQPTPRESRQLVRSIDPELQRVTNNRRRTGF